jgi:hypothetical protein
MPAQGAALRRWSPEQTEQFMALWNAGQPAAVIAERLGIHPGTVSWRAYELRQRGWPVRWRGKGWRSRGCVVARRGVVPAAAGAGPAVQDGYKIEPATLYDAEGRVIGLMDPRTRERWPA